MMPAFFEIVREASFLRQASRFAMLATFLWTLGCDDPNNVVFGIEPLRQVSEQSEMFSQLPEEDRRLLVGYLAALEARKVLGENVELVVGRTVGEVLVDARAWGEAQKALAIENQRKQEESAILRRRIVAEREQLQRKIHDSVTVAITGKFVLPEDSSIQRYSPMLIIHYAVENKSSRSIVQIKGTSIFKDAVGDEIARLPMDMDETVEADRLLKTATSNGYKITAFASDGLKRVASTPFSSLTPFFEIEAIAFDDGEVLRVPAMP